MRRKKKSVGRALFEEVGGLATKLSTALIGGIVALYVVVDAFAEAARQTAAP